MHVINEIPTDSRVALAPRCALFIDDYVDIFVLVARRWVWGGESAGDMPRFSGKAADHTGGFEGAVQQGQVLFFLCGLSPWTHPFWFVCRQHGLAL